MRTTQLIRRFPHHVEGPIATIVSGARRDLPRAHEHHEDHNRRRLHNAKGEGIDRHAWEDREVIEIRSSRVRNSAAQRIGAEMNVSVSKEDPLTRCFLGT